MLFAPSNAEGALLSFCPEQEKGSADSAGQRSMATPEQRAVLPKPNILITGTPGTGKTTTSRHIAEVTGLRCVNVGKLAQKEKCFEGHDDDYDTNILDEDKLLDIMEIMMAEGGNIVDYHSCELFPERWFDLVLVVRADNAILYDRLMARGYKKRKLDENLECEIMQVILEEARESYAPEIVHEIQSRNEEDMTINATRVQQWIVQWQADCASGNTRTDEMEE